MSKITAPVNREDPKKEYRMGADPLREVLEMDDKSRFFVGRDDVAIQALIGKSY